MLVSYLVIAACMLGAILFIPRTSFFSTRSSSQFIKELKTAGAIDPQIFWEFREFSGRGAFTFKPEGFDDAKTSAFLQEYKLASPSGFFMPFLSYSSDTVSSIEVLSVDDTLGIASNSAALQGECIINIATEKACIYEGNVWIYFVKPLEEMKTVNAFYDYNTEETAKLINGKYWFVAAKITL